MTEKMILTGIHQLPEAMKLEVLRFVMFLNHEYAQQVKTPAVKKQRVFGRSKGRYALHPDFDAPLDDFKDYK